MYGFSEDEKHLAFMDGFGLTRLSRPKQAKTDTKISASESGGRVTVSRDGSVAASYEDLWDKSVIWSFPELKASKRFDRFRHSRAVVHPEGTHFIVQQGGELLLEPLTKTVLLPLRLDAPTDTRKQPAEPVTLSLAGGVELSTVEFGGDGRLDVPASLRIAHDGTLACFDGGTLVCATLRGTKLEVHWRRAVKALAGARLEIYADADRSVLMLHRDRRWTILQRKGDDERSFEIESLGVPAVAGRYLAYQPKPDLVVRRDLDTGEQTEHSLAIYAKDRKIDLSNEGVGTVFAGARGSLLFLTSHRESILDLIAKVEVSRKLPAKELDVRQALIAITRPYVDAARLAGVCIELGRVEFNPKYNSISVSHRIAGPDNLFGALLAAHSSSVWRDCPLPGSWRMGSYGAAGAISYDPRVDVEQIIAGYTTLAEHGTGFAATIDFWAQQFDSHGRPPKDTACLALLAQVVVAVVRDGPAAPIDYAALAARGLPSIDEVIAGFQAYPQRTDALEYRTTRLAAGLFNRLYGAEAAKIYVALFLEGPAWAYYGTHYTDFGRYGAISLLEAHPEAAEVFRPWFAAGHEVDEGRRYYVDQLRARLGG